MVLAQLEQLMEPSDPFFLMFPLGSKADAAGGSSRQQAGGGAGAGGGTAGSGQGVEQVGAQRRLHVNEAPGGHQHQASHLAGSSRGGGDDGTTPATTVVHGGSSSGGGHRSINAVDLYMDLAIDCETVTRITVRCTGRAYPGPVTAAVELDSVCDSPFVGAYMGFYNPTQVGGPG